MKANLIFAVCWGICLSSIACGDEDESIPTHMWYGALTSSTNDVDQCFAFLKLVASNGVYTDPSQGRASCQFFGPQCQYRNNSVSEGQYTVFAFIDRNHNTTTVEPEPDSGDLLSSGLPLALWQSTRLDFPDRVWHLVP